MQDVRTVKLDHLAIGGGAYANEAWLLGGPIVLVGAQHGQELAKSRLDLQKGVFLDRLPGGAQPSTEGIRQLVLKLASEN